MKKILSIILILLLLAGVLAACGVGEPGQNDLEGTAQSYTRLTEWDYHPSYRFLLTNIEEQDDYLLLRGVLARDTLTPEEVKVARAEGNIEINGETFIHTDVDMEGDRLYNVHTGTEIFLVPAFFGEFEGDDVRYRMSEHDGQTLFFKKTDMYLEVEVEKTTPVEIWRLVAEPREWGHLELFAPMETSAHVFSDYTEYYVPDGFPFGGSFFFAFDNGKCIHVRWNP